MLITYLYLFTKFVKFPAFSVPFHMYQETVNKRFAKPLFVNSRLNSYRHIVHSGIFVYISQDSKSISHATVMAVLSTPSCILSVLCLKKIDGCSHQFFKGILVYVR